MQTHSFQGHFFVHLNSECQANFEWWATFVSSWNGVSLLRASRAGLPRADVNVWSDASGGWGCGAVWQGRWFQVAWESLPIAGAGIAPKELFPIIVASVVWGESWRGQYVCFHCDNEAVVSVINRQSAKEPLLCHQLRCLFFISASYEFELCATHTPGVENVAADALSRNNLSAFFMQMSTAARSPTPVPVELQVGLSVAQPQWRCRDWTTWFSTFISKP